MNLAIIGTGYVGLATGACLAQLGNSVCCVDIDREKIERMNKGILPIYEPGLEKIFLQNIRAARLFFTDNLEHALDRSEIVFFTLPTPEAEDGSADLSSVLQVAEEVGKIIRGYKVIVNKSTVPVGTCEKVRKTIAGKTDQAFDVVSNPEFLREGFAVHDFMNPDRIVIGTQSNRAKNLMQELYRPFSDKAVPILCMDEKSSELTKYAANSFLSVKISFMNEMANFCEKIGADVEQIRLGIGADERIGSRFLFPGIGYGGSCFPKDVKALIKSGEERNFHFQILKSCQRVNEIQKTILVEAIEHYFNGNLKGKSIAIWGLSFKANTDDIREASSLDNIKSLLNKGCFIKVHDPAALEVTRKIFGNQISYAENMYEALEGCDALLICTEWDEFKNPNLSLMAKKMRNRAIFDGRNVLQISPLRQHQFFYKGIGKGTLK